MYFARLVTVRDRFQEQTLRLLQVSATERKRGLYLLVLLKVMRTLFLVGFGKADLDTSVQHQSEQPWLWGGYAEPNDCPEDGHVIAGL